MIRDRSILARFNPDGSLKDQYLQRHDALLAEGEWEWQERRALAHVFESHEAAETFAISHSYLGSDGIRRTPWALVLGPLSAPESPRHAAEIARAAEVKTRQRFGAVSPTEAFEQMEKRHLA